MTDRTTSFGDVTLDRVDEWTGKLFTRPDLLPDSDRQAWEAERAWLEPDFWSANSEDAGLCAQSFLVHSGGRTILVDTGIGNAKPRPSVPPFDHLDTAYLDDLAAMGVRPTDVDLVVCTHLHPDHVGWNTTLVDGEWRPTFPNATYLLPKADFDHLAKMAKSGDTPDPLGNVAAFRDSVLPVVENAKTQLWEGEEHVIDDALRLVASPGHSPGACVLTISSSGEKALLMRRPRAPPDADSGPGAAQHARRGRGHGHSVADPVARVGGGELRAGVRRALPRWAGCSDQQRRRCLPHRFLDVAVSPAARGRHAFRFTRGSRLDRFSHESARELDHGASSSVSARASPRAPAVSDLAPARV